MTVDQAAGCGFLVMAALLYVVWRLTIAFGSFLPLIVLGQFAAKVGGGFVWSLFLAVPVRRRAA